MNYLKLCQRLRQECGGSGSGPTSVAGQRGESQNYVDWISQAWLEIQQERQEWRFMWGKESVSLVAGTRLYAKPDGVKSIVPDSVKINGHIASMVDYEAFRTRYDADTPSIPRVIAEQPDGQIIISGTPDAAYTLTFEVNKRPQLLVDDDDIPSIPEEFHMAIVYRAMIDYAGFENAGEVYARAQKRLSDIMTALADDQLPPMSFAGPIA
ncbi:phage adaptor protein [Aliamphritea hakodatensis]|uniref:phage adaptor protein n=1 Tax=Aliamphritea hakodatensis TaxID=2895352 RepID=UPI0022FD462B|nr:hypothetical protein [Aliamphritea hakodatensis]